MFSIAEMKIMKKMQMMIVGVKHQQVGVKFSNLEEEEALDEVVEEDLIGEEVVMEALIVIEVVIEASIVIEVVVEASIVKEEVVEDLKVIEEEVEEEQVTHKLEVEEEELIEEDLVVVEEGVEVDKIVMVILCLLDMIWPKPSPTATQMQDLETGCVPTLAAGITTSAGDQTARSVELPSLMTRPTATLRQCFLQQLTGHANTSSARTSTRAAATGAASVGQTRQRRRRMMRLTSAMISREVAATDQTVATVTTPPDYSCVETIRRAGVAETSASLLMSWRLRSK